MACPILHLPLEHLVATAVEEEAEAEAETEDPHSEGEHTSIEHLATP